MGGFPPPLPRLNVILDEDVARAAGWTMPALARACLAGGARFLQVRAKRLTSGACVAVCDEVMALAREHDAIVIVNDRADVARLSGAAGVHVGQDDLAPVAARATIGDAALVGLSTHTAEQVRAALTQPIDYIGVGPVFRTATKKTGYTEVGFDLVRQAADLVRDAVIDENQPGRPIVAIGGISLGRAAAVCEAGASCVAVISDLMATGDPEARVREYLEVLGAVS